MNKSNNLNLNNQHSNESNSEMIIFTDCERKRIFRTEKNEFDKFIETINMPNFSKSYNIFTNMSPDLQLLTKKYINERIK